MWDQGNNLNPKGWQNEGYSDTNLESEDYSSQENQSVKTFVSVVSIFGFFVFLFGGSFLTYLIFYAVNNSFDRQNWGLLFNHSPMIYMLGPIAYFISIGFLYLFFKLRTLNVKAIFTALGFQILAGAFAMLNLLTFKAVGQSGVSRSSGIHLLDVLEISFELLVVVLLACILVIPFIHKKFNQGGSVTPAQKFRVFLYSLLVVVFVMILFVPGMFAGREEPFVGFQIAESKFGKSPVLVTLPAEYKQVSFVWSQDKKYFFIGYAKTKDFGNIDNMILVTQEPIAVSSRYDADVHYVEKENKRTAVFVKNDYAVAIITSGNSQVSKEALLKIAQSAK